MSSSQAGGRSTVLAALTEEPTTTSDLYDRVGYPALMRVGLINYDSFRSVLVTLETERLAVSAPAPDGMTFWRRPDPPAAAV
jgi:hypothetical protein